MPRSAAKRVGPQEKPSEPVLEDAEAAPERPFVAAVGTAETEGGLEVDRNVFKCESERDTSIKWHASRSDRRVPFPATPLHTTTRPDRTRGNQEQAT